jgi:hypothetical protein
MICALGSYTGICPGALRLTREAREATDHDPHAVAKWRSFCGRIGFAPADDHCNSQADFREGNAR